MKITDADYAVVPGATSLPLKPFCEVMPKSVTPPKPIKKKEVYDDWFIKR